MDYQRKKINKTKSEEIIKPISNNFDLLIQNEKLKEKLKQLEDETNSLLNKQKEDYEVLIKEKDEEISNLVDQLVTENTNLKKQIEREIDIECLKENIDELQNRCNELEKNKFTNNFSVSNKFIEKDFMTNVKNIEENHVKRNKEIDEKYEMIFKSLNREYRGNISNFRKVSLENKNKYSNNKGFYDKEEIILLSQIEEIILTFVNKFQLIYEELKDKEKFTIDLEEKFELINEENKFLKRKIAEEKSTKNSEEFMNSNKEKNKIDDNNKNFNSPIKLGSTLQKHIEKSLENNDKILKERDDLRDKMNSLKRNFEDMKEQLSACIGEKEEIEVLLLDKEKAYKTVSINLEIMQKEFKVISNEKGIISRAFDDLTLRSQELNNKYIGLESKYKTSNETILGLKQEILLLNEEQDKKIDLLKEEIIELKRKIREMNGLFENEKMNWEVKTKEMDIEISSLEKEIESIEKKNREIFIEKEKIINEKEKSYENLKTNYRILTDELEEEKRKREKYEKMSQILNEEIEKLNKDKEKLYEKLNKNQKIESEKPNENVELVSSLKKSQSKFNNELIQKLYSSNNLEKNIKVINETTSNNNSQKLIILENTNAELRKELLYYRQTISKMLDNIKISVEKNKLKIKIKSVNDDMKILNEIESFITELIGKNIAYETQINSFDEKNLKQTYEKQNKLINDLANEKIKYDEEIRNLKKKLIYHNISLINPFFKLAETNKSSQNSLYEALIILLKNMNIKYIFDLFEIKLHHEEDKQKLQNELRKSINVETNNSKRLEILTKEFKDYKKFCETLFLEYDKRSKIYISPEDYSTNYIEFKEYCESMFDFVFSNFMNFKKEEGEENIIFSIPINIFNEIIEKIHQGFLSYDDKVTKTLSEYSKLTQNTEKAIEVLLNQTKLDQQLIDNLINNPLSSKLI